MRPSQTQQVRRDWHQLIARLKDRGVHSPLVEQLRGHLSTEEQHDHLEQEVRSEIARALGRAEAKVIASILEIAVADADIDETADAESKTRALETREALRQAALLARQDYKIHREAVGLRRNAHLNDLFPIPPRRS